MTRHDPRPERPGVVLSYPASGGPRRIVFADELPTTPAGKIATAARRERYGREH